jgi:cytochrome c-type biogenesis protein CcmF
MNEIGELCLLLSLGIAVYSSIVSVLGEKRKRKGLIASAENSLFVLFVLITISSATLISAFLRRDFSVEYVANYSNKDLSLFYTLSAFWAGQKGSLLLWAWLLSIFSAVVVLQNRNKNREFMPYVISISSITLCLFLALMVFASRPFELMYPPEDGYGLNPLLQNPGMVFHPPTLYLGFVGFTIPFAFAMSSLLSGHLGDTWIKTTRRWTIFSWFFLSMGNLLGAWWAYRVLGWGGYWAWDPVENASFMPWLTATAYLHSVMIQERRDMLKVWNMVLIVVTFSLTIFGTFLTRSGVIQSVHSFGESTVGYYFLVFLILTIGFSFYLIMNNFSLLKSNNELDSIISRESSFLFNNLILVGAAFATFWGTMFPVISETIRGQKLTVGPPFFNQVNIPIGLALLLLIGICPLISWKRSSINNLKRNFFKPFVISIIGGIVLIPVGIGHLFAWLSFTISIFVVSTILIEFYKGVDARRNSTGEGFVKALFFLTGKNKRRYGGYIIHIGVVLMYVGITGSSYNIEKEATLKKGESMEIGDYRLIYKDLANKMPVPTRIEVVAAMDIEKDGKIIATALPRREFYKNSEQPISRVYNLSGFKEDLYIILAAFNEDNSATFKIHVNPLVKWLWIGGIVIGLGTFIAMLPDRKEKEGMQVTEKGKQKKESRISSTAYCILVICFLLFFSGSVSALTIDEKYMPLYDELSGKFMCLCGCGSLIKTCPHQDCNFAIPFRKELSTRIQNGETKEQIIGYFVNKHGERILSAPTKRGFNLVAWITPFAVIIIVGFFIKRIIHEWATKGITEEAKGSDFKTQDSLDKYKKILEKELEEFER